MGSGVGVWVEMGPRGGGPGLTDCPWQEAGEICLNSAQCKSECCHRESSLSLARCAAKASENSECSAWVGTQGVGVMLLVVGGEGWLRGGVPSRLGHGGRRVSLDIGC